MKLLPIYNKANPLSSQEKTVHKINTYFKISYSFSFYDIKIYLNFKYRAATPQK